MKTKTDCGIIIDDYIERKCAETGWCWVTNLEATTDIFQFGERIYNQNKERVLYSPETYRRILEMKVDNNKIRKLTDEEKEKLGKKRGYTVYKCQLQPQCELF